VAHSAWCTETRLQAAQVFAEIGTFAAVLVPPVSRVVVSVVVVVAVLLGPIVAPLNIAVVIAK